MALLLIISIFVFLAIAVITFTRQPNFGKNPFGERLARIQQSPHHKNGQFNNLSRTPQLTEGANFFTILMRYPFK